MSDFPRPRIAYLISQYPAYNHTFILREVRELRALGWDIQTISIRPTDRATDKLTAEEAEEYRRTLYIKSDGLASILWAHLLTLAKHPVAYIATMIYALRSGHGGVHRLLYFVEAIVAGARMEALQIGHVHVHFASTVALLLHKVFPITISITIHGPDEFTDPAGFCMREKIEAAAFIVAISKFARSQLMRYSAWDQWDKLEVCRLGINAEVFQPREVNSGTNHKPVRIISVARLAPVKGQHILIGAVERLRREGLTVRLSLVGDGPDRRSLEERAKHLSDCVVFEGWCNQDRVQAIYAQTDVFVLASFAEGIPVVLMEAMAMQIPCVATNITGVPELITNGTDGLLVTPSDDEELATAIKQMVESPEFAARLGRAGRSKVLQDFSLVRNVERLSALFERRLASQR